MNFPQALERVKQLQKENADLKRSINFSGVPSWVLNESPLAVEWALTILYELQNPDYDSVEKIQEYVKGKLDEYEQIRINES